MDQSISWIITIPLLFLPRALIRGDRRIMEAATDGKVIDVPTVHIWGRNNQRYGYRPQLSALCCRRL
ncbi:hypothetical protein EYZ11_001913 [Aspergillus tanneri]|uniref:Uncharacterized protein n=1 Tax=Aspergillus tanneri TaxID=1220188 RepID=A0A4S3JSP9_9EURO|nr:hypothetical protein EYZ11_001913 [Aspergillus tanneri]